MQLAVTAALVLLVFGLPEATATYRTPRYRNPRSEQCTVFCNELADPATSCAKCLALITDTNEFVYDYSGCDNGESFQYCCLKGCETDKGKKDHPWKRHGHGRHLMQQRFSAGRRTAKTVQATASNVARSRTATGRRLASKCKQNFEWVYCPRTSPQCCIQGAEGECAQEFVCQYEIVPEQICPTCKSTCNGEGERCVEPYCTCDKGLYCDKETSTCKRKCERERD